MANGRYMYIPWAHDITSIGAAALLLDRRGQGRSDGTLWQSDVVAAGLDDRYPDLATAIAFLRSLTPLVDPTRIALLGHSDGATAALIAGSSDWEVRATIAVSPSTGPWQYVNHVSPQNLLLIFGAEDGFVLHDTDTALISRATRYGLADEGRVGDVDSGDARALVRVLGRGHLDVLTAAATRAEVRNWLIASLQLSPNASGESQSGSRSVWLTIGILSLAALLTFRRNPTPLTASRTPMLRSLMPIAAVGIAWSAGLSFSAALEQGLRPLLPGQETAVFVALIVGPCVGLTVFALCVRLVDGRGESISVVSPSTPRSNWVKDMSHGLVAAACVILGLKVLLWNHYEVSLTPGRGCVLLIVVAVLIPSFMLMFTAMRQISVAIDPGYDPSGMVVSGSLVIGGLLTAAFTPWLFTRMGMAGGYLTAAALTAVAGYHFGLGGRRIVATVAFGGGLVATVTAMACTLY